MLDNALHLVAMVTAHTGQQSADSALHWCYDGVWIWSPLRVDPALHLLQDLPQQPEHGVLHQIHTCPEAGVQYHSHCQPYWE